MSNVFGAANMGYYSPSGVDIGVMIRVMSLEVSPSGNLVCGTQSVCCSLNFGLVWSKRVCDCVFDCLQQIV